MDSTYLLFAVALFIAVILLAEGLYFWWESSRGPDARRVARRLRMMSAGTGQAAETSIVKQRLLSERPALQRALLAMPRVHELDRLLVQSGLNLNVAGFLGFTAAAGLAGLLVPLLPGWPLLLAALVGAGAAMLPLLVVLNARRRRLQRIERRLPDALDLMGRAMRAGHAFPTAMKMVGDELPEPIAGEFRVVFDEVNYGIPMQTALMNLATRVPGTDLSYFVVAVLIQRETGGNLAELLDKLATLVRARFKLLGTIRVLSAEGRLSAWILSLLPFCTAVLIQIVNPKFLRVLWTDPLGWRMVIGALVLMAFGILWMRRIIRIRL